MNSLEKTHIPTDTQESNIVVESKESNIVVESKESNIVVESKETIAKTMNEAKFPKDYMDYPFQFDDGNHPGWDTQQSTFSNGPNNFDISHRYIRRRLPWIVSYIHRLKEHLLTLQKDIWNKDLLDFSTEKRIAGKITESTLTICQLLNNDKHIWQNPVIGSISHNLKNIFGNITAFLDLLSPEHHTEESAEEERKLEMIDILLTIINKAYLFCASSIEHLKNWIQLVPVHFHKYRKEVEHSYKEECDRHNITLLTDLPIDFITDDFILRSVIEDLFSNALKYTPQGWVIAIRTNSICNNRDIEIHLFNSWSSIPSEKDPFNVTQSTPWERNWIGTGIWLKGVQQLLANTESTISYKNTTHNFPNHPECNGVEFTFSLPFSSLQEQTQNK